MDHLVEIAKLEERIKSLERWQEDQNGTLLRVSEKIDKLYSFVISALASGVISLILLALNLLKGKM